MAHEYKKEADASHARKLKSYGATTSSSVDGANEDGDATNFAGFRALNTNKQAGMSPLNKKGSMSDGTMSRIMRKKGGAVHGAESLKRLDKAGRKSKAAGGGLKGTGQRIGPIPSADTQQMDFDPTTRVNPGEMSPGTQRKKGGRIQDYEARSHESQGAQGKRPYEGHKKGGRVKKADGGGLEEILGSIGNALFGEQETAPARREAAAASRGMGRHSAPHPVVRRRITEVEHPVVAQGGPEEMAPLPPSRPSELRAPAISDADATANFLASQGVGARPAPAASADSSTANPFYARELYARKDGGRLGRKSGGKAFEGSAKDEREDKKLEKKYGMSHKEWEASDLDKKHDSQESMKGLRAGGRAHRAKGGKTTVNIMLGEPQQQGPNPMQAAAMAAMLGKGGPQGGPMLPPPGAPPMAPPLGAPPMAAPPPQMPPQMPPQAGPGGPPMPRKDGGKVQVPYRKPGRKDDYPAMDFGSGGGFGRRQKIQSYGTKGPKGDSV